MRRYVITGIILVAILFSTHFVAHASSMSPPGLGFGKCHSAGDPLNRSELINWFYSGGYTESWLDVEETRGVFDFSKWDAMRDSVFRRYPNASFWLNVLTAQQDSVPQWAKDDPSLGYIATSQWGGSSFPIWNPDFQRAFEMLQTKFSEHIYSPSFRHRDKIKAVVMMGGGQYGEMIAWSNCPSSDACRGWVARGYTDEKYYDALVNWLVPLYARLFPDYPLVLQLGGGLGQPGYSGNVGKQAARTLIDRYGTRMYIKWNGWNYQYSTNPNNTDRYYHDFMATIADEVRVGFEPGGATNINSGQSQILYDSILQTMGEMPLSYFCLQTQFLNALTDDQLRELSRHFRGLQIQYPNFNQGSPPTAAPSPTPQQSPTQVPTNPVYPTNTPFIQPTTPPGEPTYTPIPPTLKPPYEVTNTPVPSPTQSSWIANLFTPKEPTPTISFTNIPITERKGFNMKDLVCREESGPSSVMRSVVYLPTGILTELLKVDTTIEKTINTWLEGVRSRLIH